MLVWVCLCVNEMEICLMNWNCVSIEIRVSECVCLFVPVCVCIDACVCVYVCPCLCVCVYPYLCVCVSMPVWVCVSMPVCVCVIYLCVASLPHSAGGTGVLLNVDPVAELLEGLGHPGIQVRGLADSGWFLDNKQYRSTDCHDTISCAPTEAIKRGIK